MHVLAEAGTVPDALRMARAHRPDVLVLDLNMPGGSGLEAIPTILEETEATAIVVLTMQNDPSFARQALQAGALGFVLKEAADDELLGAIRLAAEGETYLNPRLGARLAAQPDVPAGRPTIFRTANSRCSSSSRSDTRMPRSASSCSSACGPSSRTARTSSRRPAGTPAPSSCATHSSTVDRAHRRLSGHAGSSRDSQRSRRSAYAAGSTPPLSAEAASRACSACVSRQPPHPRRPAAARGRAPPRARRRRRPQKLSGRGRSAARRRATPDEPWQGTGRGSAPRPCPGPPERARGDLAGEAARADLARATAARIEFGAQVQRRSAGEQQPAQDGRERNGLHRRAELVGDRGGGGVGLLRRKTALLDRETGGVTGGQHAACAHDVPVRVRRQEALGVARQARDPPVRPRQEG